MEKDLSLSTRVGVVLAKTTEETLAEAGKTFLGELSKEEGDILAARRKQILDVRAMIRDGVIYW